MAKVNFDGLCEPKNPGGIATYAYVIKIDNQVLQGYGLAEKPWSKDSTNNVAEYMGAYCAIRKLIQLGITKAIFYGDSQLIIRQLSGEYRIKSPRLKRIYDKIQESLKNFEHIEFKWIPREENTEADRLTRIAYKLALENKLKEIGCRL
jgi:ribonuclease HI